MELAETFRTRQIPCDVIYLDIDYMDGYRIFTWNSNRFPDPEGMMAELKEQGFRVVTIVDPAIRKDSDYPVYMEGLGRDIFANSPQARSTMGRCGPARPHSPISPGTKPGNGGD